MDNYWPLALTTILCSFCCCDIDEINREHIKNIDPKDKYYI